MRIFVLGNASRPGVREAAEASSTASFRYESMRSASLELPMRAHGKDERVNVKAFFTGQEYLYELVKQLSGARQGRAGPEA